MNKVSLSITAAVLTLSVAAGALYQTLCSPSAELGAYLGSFAASLSNGVDHKNILLNSLKDSLMTVGIIFVCGFVRPGAVISLLCAARKCFVSGFTTAAFIDTRGLHGLLAAAAAALPFMLTLIPLALMCAFSVSMSFSGDRSERRGAYILSALAAALIFSAAVLCESYAVPFFLMHILK